MSKIGELASASRKWRVSELAAVHSSGNSWWRVGLLGKNHGGSYGSLKAFTTMELGLPLRAAIAKLAKLGASADRYIALGQYELL